MMTFFGLFGHRNIVALLVAEQAVAGDVAIGKRLHALHERRLRQPVDPCQRDVRQAPPPHDRLIQPQRRRAQA